MFRHFFYTHNLYAIGCFGCYPLNANALKVRALFIQRILSVSLFRCLCVLIFSVAL